MKNYLFLSLILIALTSACVNQGASNGTGIIIPGVNAGKLQVSISDDFQKLMGLGKATSLNLTINEIYVNKSGNFLKIMDKPKTLDLMVYSKDNLALVSDPDVESGTYSQIKLKLSNASIKIYDLDFNIFNKTFPLVLVSDEVVLKYTFTVETGKTTNLILDFDVPQSITKVSAYLIEYRLTPVIAVSQEDKACDRCVTIA